MTRRDLIPGLLALMLVPLTVATVLRLFPDPPRTKLAFPRPTHRVAVALDRALRDQGATVGRPVNTSFNQDMRFRTVTGAPPPAGSIVLKDDDPAFWIAQGKSKQPRLMRLTKAVFAGTTRDGRAFEATIEPDPIVEGTVIDFHGDAALAEALSSRISLALDLPGAPHDSPEDRAALAQFFQGPTPTPAPTPPTVAAPPPGP